MHPERSEGSAIPNLPRTPQQSTREHQDPCEPTALRKRILVTGGAGFLGSHLCERLLADGHDVLCVDNFFTGTKDNIAHLLGNPHFELMRHDVTFPLFVEVDEIYNLACPASPIHYQYDPVQTTKTSVHGAINMLGLAKRVKAKILQASTSEVYGDPKVHPQTEDYWGNVNPIGLRSCYDEGKRCAETLFFDYHRQHKLRIKVARIFNTYGPRMHPNDGRVVSNFIVQALKGEPITIYGDGSQTRSFCYVDDLVDGLMRLMNSPDDFTGPVNLGNPGEFTILELAQKVIELTGSKSQIVFKPLPSDDPTQRQPDIGLAKAKSWMGACRSALRKTMGLTRAIIAYFRARSNAGDGPITPCAASPASSPTANRRRPLTRRSCCASAKHDPARPGRRWSVDLPGPAGRPRPPPPRDHRPQRAGAQPMATADGRLPHHLQRRDLQLPRAAQGARERRVIVFRSNSDTEVLLHLYASTARTWCMRCAACTRSRIWDERRKGLFLARDPFGIKPLYYADDGATLRFASQVKALLAGDGISVDAGRRRGTSASTSGATFPSPTPCTAESARCRRAPPCGSMHRGPTQIASDSSMSRDDLRGGRNDQEQIDARGNAGATLAGTAADSVAPPPGRRCPGGRVSVFRHRSPRLTALASELERELHTLTLGFREFQGTTE